MYLLTAYIPTYIKITYTYNIVLKNDKCGIYANIKINFNLKLL